MKKESSNTSGSTFKSKKGYLIDKVNRVWELDHRVKLDLNFIHDHKNFTQEEKETLINYFENLSKTTGAHYCVGLRCALLAQLKSINKLIPDSSSLVVLREKILNDDFSPQYYGYIKRFIIDFVDSGFSGVSDDTYELALKIKAPSQSSRFDPVRLKDSIEGALTPLECEALLSRLLNKYEKTLKITDYAAYLLVLFTLSTGLRPEQTARIRRKDYSFSFSKVEAEIIKQKNSIKNKRTDILLNPELNKAIQLWIEMTSGYFEESDEPDSIPLFRSPRHNGVDKLVGDNLGRRLAYQLKKLQIISPRTGNDLKVNFIRMRHTFATRIAEVNPDPYVIAESLTHTSISTAQRYIDISKELSEEIDKHINSELTIIANMFQGKVVRDLEEAKATGQHKGTVESRHGTSGSCATRFDCHRFAPYACYTCPLFRPFLDARHEKLLEELLEEREKQKSHESTRLMANSMDGIIQAIKEVIKICNEMKGKAE